MPLKYSGSLLLKLIYKPSYMSQQYLDTDYNTWVAALGPSAMPKASNGKRKANASEVASRAKRQKATNAPKTPKKNPLKAKKLSASVAMLKPLQGDASRTLVLQDLPDNVLANVFCALGLDRLRAMQGTNKGSITPTHPACLPVSWLNMPHVSAVCKRWQRLGRDPCFTRVVSGETINETISQARPGDTIELKPGFYQEVVLVEKPLKFVGQYSIDPKLKRRYKDAVLQSNRSMAVMCNARCVSSLHFLCLRQTAVFLACHPNQLCRESLRHAALPDGCFASRVCFDSLTIRTILPGADRSIVGFGPDCSYIALHDCDLDGISGLLVPRTKVSPCHFAAPEWLLQPARPYALSPILA